MDINYSVAMDDSCQVQLYAKGHFQPGQFKAECERFYRDNFESELSAVDMPTKHIYWRNVPAPSDNIVGDRQFIESKKAPGAYPVTLLDKWLPISAP